MNIFKTIRHWWLCDIKYPIKNWFFYDSPIYIDFNIFKCIWWYVKCCTVFKSPNIEIYTKNEINSDYWLTPTIHNCSNKWLHISVYSIYLKWKWDELRHEQNPNICIIWRNKKRIIIGFESPLYDHGNNQ